MPVGLTKQKEDEVVEEFVARSFHMPTNDLAGSLCWNLLLSNILIILV